MTTLKFKIVPDSFPFVIGLFNPIIIEKCIVISLSANHVISRSFKKKKKKALSKRHMNNRFQKWSLILTIPVNFVWESKLFFAFFFQLLKELLFYIHLSDDLL
jgi:hypothetical protein